MRSSPRPIQPAIRPTADEDELIEIAGPPMGSLGDNDEEEADKQNAAGADTTRRCKRDHSRTLMGRIGCRVTGAEISRYGPRTGSRIGILLSDGKARRHRDGRAGFAARRFGHLCA
jgi:hypothetical protein